MAKFIYKQNSGDKLKMKNLILSIFIFLTFLVASLTINSGTVNATNVLDDPYYEVMINNHVKITFVYDGPGGKLINVMIEHID
jgi:hypothetical protein